jgi:hypothetical protein
VDLVAANEMAPLGRELTMGAAQRLREAFAVNLSAPHSEPADTFAFCLPTKLLSTTSLPAKNLPKSARKQSPSIVFMVARNSRQR